jgi:hypothetical protein
MAGDPANSIAYGQTREVLGISVMSRFVIPISGPADHLESSQTASVLLIRYPFPGGSRFRSPRRAAFQRRGRNDLR